MVETAAVTEECLLLFIFKVSIDDAFDDLLVLLPPLRSREM